MKKIVFFIPFVFFIIFVSAQQKTLTENFLNNVGDTVIVSGRIYNGAFLTHVKTKPTFLNLGDTSPKHRLIIRIEPEDRAKFPSPPETFFLNKVVVVTGKLQEYKGSPLIQISEPAMIKTTEEMVDSLRRPTNNYTAVAVLNTSNNTAINLVNPPPITSSLRLIVPDSVLQTTWIKSVAEKAVEDKKKNVRLVQREMELRTAPFREAPLIAQLQPGMLVSILYTSKKWSYISIGSIDGFNNVNGFIKNKRFRHLKKVQGQ